NGSAWLPVGSGGTSGAGISLVDGEATQPRLAASGGQLYLLWSQNRFFDFAADTSMIYARRWNGTAFAEDLPGEASRQGISDTGIGPQALATAVDNTGHVFVAWNDLASGGSQICVRGNQTALGNLYYVNGSVNAGDTF